MKNKKKNGLQSTETLYGFKKRLIDVLDEEQQVWWSERLSISQSVLSGGWKKKSFPRSDNLLKICEIKDISANWLLFGLGPKRLSDFSENRLREARQKKDQHQERIMQKSEEILMLKQRVSELERALASVELSNLVKYRSDIKKTGMDTEIDIFNENVIPLITLMRLIQDILFKVFEEYSKENLSTERYNSIFSYLTENFEAHTYEVIATLKELETKFKK